MSNLIISGNTNPRTFANSIVAAEGKSVQVFGERLDWIYVLHSSESQQVLSQDTNWTDHLRNHGISREQFVEKVVEVGNSEQSMHSFLDYIERTLKSLPENARLMVDLTNGTSFQKALLSVTTYLLDINHQYMIDIASLSALTDDRGYLPQTLLLQAYVAAPDSTLLDTIAYLNISEMVRYRRIIQAHMIQYSNIDPTNADSAFFADNLEHSVRLKMQGDKARVDQPARDDLPGAGNVIYRIAAASMASSVEDLIRLLIAKYDATGPAQLAKLTLGQRLRIVEAAVEKNPPADFDLEFFYLFNSFMLFLRNSTTHKGRLLTDLERFKAELTLKMSFPYIEFYTDIVTPILAAGSPREQPVRVTRISFSETGADEQIYYGLDGDDTGMILEEILMTTGDERACERHSKAVSKAIADVSKQIKSAPDPKSIVFSAGDDLLFKGRFDEDALRKMQATYHRVSGGLTCSIGYGRTLQEVYVALKWAKTTPGKNAIVGVKLA